MEPTHRAGRGPRRGLACRPLSGLWTGGEWAPGTAGGCGTPPGLVSSAVLGRRGVGTLQVGLGDELDPGPAAKRLAQTSPTATRRAAWTSGTGSGRGAVEGARGVGGVGVGAERKGRGRRGRGPGETEVATVGGRGGGGRGVSGGLGRGKGRQGGEGETAGAGPSTSFGGRASSLTRP